MIDVGGEIMGQRVLTCIGCPMGCTLYVKIEDNQVKGVTGNTCVRYMPEKK